MKKSWLGAMALILPISLAGCGGSAPTSSSASGTVDLITWVNPPAVKVLTKINQEFHKKYPNITVKYQTAANRSGPYATLEQTAVRGGTVDIMGTGPIQPLPLRMTSSNLTPEQLWATHNVYMPLNSQPWVKNFSPAIFSSETYKGKLYGLVTGVYQEGVFYNKSIFAKYHISVPTTYNQFIHDAQVLKSHGVTPFFVGLQNVGPAYLQFIYQELMAELWVPQVGNVNKALWSGKVKWTNPTFIKVLSRERTIMHYLEPNFTGVPWQSMPGDFANGQAAMLFDGSWDLASIQAANPSIKVGFFPLPGSNTPANNQPITSGDLTFVVLAHGPNHAAALKWLQFFATPKIYQQYVDATGISPSEVSGHYSSYASQVLGSWFGKGVSSAVAMPDLPASGPYWDQAANWPKAQLDMYQGTYSPQQVAKLYQQGWSQVTH